MLTHFEDGKAVMVDISGKDATARTAVAEARVRLPRAVKEALDSGGVGKGNPLQVAELAGIMGAKRTSELIPL
ncbi:MAG TPA: cyclic pyranopterin monophosphate synthase MoaC, partial [Trueperaceae bacterium]